MYTCTTSVSSANTCRGLSEGLAAAEAVTMTAADVVSKSAAKVTYMAMTKASCSAAKVVKAAESVVKATAIAAAVKAVVKAAATIIVAAVMTPVGLRGLIAGSQLKQEQDTKQQTGGRSHL